MSTREERARARRETWDARVVHAGERKALEDDGD
jgi:hypothetical protein